MTVLFLTKHF